MAKQLNLDLNVRANTQQAKQEFQNLQKSLSDVVVQASKINNTSINTNSLKQASAAAQELQRHLSNAVNVDTGKINLNKLNTSLKQSKTNIGELSGKLLSVGPAGQQAFVQLAQSVAAAERPVISLGSRLSGLLITLKNTARWQISSTILHGFMGALQGAYGYAQDLNKSLNNIRIVTGQTTDQMEKFAIEANRAAKSLSTSTTAYTDAALIYYQQGLGDAEVKERTEATIKLANVSRQSAEEVSSQMTAIWNNFKTEGKTVEYYADVITALGANTASSSSEIAEGLSKFAAVADTVGLSYEKASAALATVVAETRQSADVVGTAFKTMFARIEGLKQGETLEDGVGLNKYSEALQKVGVNVLDSNNQLKQMDTILDELGNKWNQIDKTQQVALAQTVAGVRQYTQFISLMDNYDKVSANEDIAKNSEGTVQKQADIYAESWEAAQKRVKASLQSIYKDLIDDKFFIEMANGFASLLNSLNAFIKGIGGLYPLLMGLGSFVLKGIADKIQPAIVNLGISLKTMFQTPEQQAKSYSDMMNKVISVAQTSTGLISNNFSASQQVVLDYAHQLSAAKNKMMVVDKNLTNQERLQNEMKLSFIAAQQEEIQAIADKITQEEQNIDTMMDSMNAEQSIIELERLRSSELQKLKNEAEAAMLAYSNNKTSENKDAYEQKSQALRNYSAHTEDLTNKQELLTTALLNAYEQSVRQANGFTVIGDTSVSLMGTLDGLEKEIDDLGTKDFKGIRSGLGQLKKDLNQLGLGDIPEVEDAFMACLKAGNTKELKKQMENLKTVLKGIKIEGKDLSAILKKLGESNNVKKINTAYTNLNKEQKKLKDAQIKLNQAFENFNPKHVMGGVEALTKVASAGMQAGMVMQSVRSMFDALSNSDLSFGEKITTSLMSIGMIVPSVISALSTMKNVYYGAKAAIDAFKVSQEASNLVTEAGIALKGKKIAVSMSSIAAEGAEAGAEEITTAAKIAKTAVEEGVIAAEQEELLTQSLLHAEQLKGSALTTKEIGFITGKVAATNMSTLAQEGETVATASATTAQWGLNAAMEANPIGAVIAAIAALIAALALLTFALFSAANAESEEAKAVEEANKALDEAKEAAQNAKQAYEDLKSAISKYDTAVDALKKCTKGTQEWRDAFKEVLLQANEIIQKYPQLLKYEKIFNSDGTLNTETLNKALKDAEDYSLSSQNIVLIRQNDVTKAEYNLKKKDLINKAANQAGEMNKNYGSTGATKKTNNSSASGTSTKSASMQEITENVIKNIGDKIGNNYDNKDNIKELVKNYLKEQNTFKFKNDNKLNEAIEAISSSITKVSGNFVELSETTEQTMDTMNNASKMLLQNLFGDEINADNELAYINATAKKRQELETKYQKGYLYMADEDVDKKSSFLKDDVDKKGNGDDIVNGAIAIEMIEKYLELHKDDYIGYDETDVTDWKGGKNGTVWVNLKSKEGNEVEIKASDIKDDVIENELAKVKGEISQAAKEEVNKQEYKDKMSKAVTRYLTDNNFDNATIGSIKAAKKDDLIAEFQGKDGEIDKEKVKTFLEKKYPGQSIGDSEINSFIDNFNPELESALEQINKIPTVLQEGIRKELVNSLTIDEAQKVGKMYNKAIIKEGEDGVAILDNIVESAGNEAGKVMTALADIDLSNLNTEEVNQQLKSLGIQFQLTDSQFYSFKNAVKDLGVVTTESAQETYKNITSILSKIKKIGDSLEDADYQKLLAVNPAISSFFTTMADGTHMLTGAVQDFKKAVQSATINELYSAQKNDEETAAAYGNLSKGYIKRSEMDDGAYTVPGVSQTQYRDTGLWSKYQDQTLAQIKILRDQGGESVDLANRLEVQIRDQEDLPQVVLDTAEAYDKLNLSAEDYATKAKEASEEAKKLAESIKEAQYQNEISNAGLEYETTENYANVLMELYEAQGLSKDAARELSIANQRLDNGLSSLNDNFEDWSKSLKNTNKASAEYAETVTSIREAFANLLNVADGNELSLKWLESWMNDSSEMEKILDGDTKALQRFRESAFKEMTTNVFSDMKNSISDMLKELDSVKDKDYIASLQAISDTLASGAFEADNLRAAIVDLGNQEIGSGATLSQEYVDSLNEMLAQGLLTEQQLNDIFATIGYKPKVTTKNVQQWVDIPVYETTEKITEGTKNPNADGTSTYTRTVESSTKQIRTEHMQQNVPVAQIESADEATGNIEIVNAGNANIIPSYSSTSSGKSSDDSNSSSDNKTTSAASHEHEVNRYSDEENAINGLADQYERLGKIKDKAFGAGVLQAMEKELSKLKELKQASSNYLEAIVGNGNAEKVAKTLYSGGDIGSLISSGQLGGTIAADYRSLFSGASASGKNVEYTAKDSAGNEWLASTSYNINDMQSIFGSSIGFQLDSYGNITNKDSILNELQRLTNSENDNFAQYSNPDAASTTEHNKRLAYLEEIKSRVEQYGTTVEDLSTQADAYLDYISQIQEKNAELISTKLNTGITLSNNTLTRLERAIKILGDDIYKSTEKMITWFDTKLKSNRNEYQEQAKLNEDAIADIQERVKLYQENPLDENAISPAKAAELAQGIEENYASLYEKAISDITEMEEQYGNTLDTWKEKISEVTTSIDFNIEKLSHLRKVFELLGKKADYEKLGYFLEQQAAGAETRYQVSKKEADKARQLYSKHEAYANTLNDKEKEQYEKDVLAKDRELLQEWEKEEQSNFQSWIEALQEVHDNNINKIYQQFEDNLTSEYGSFSNLDASMQRQQSITDEYLTKTNQLYETNKMLRNLQKDIDKTDNRMAKERLKAFSNEINSMKEKEKLTKTDLELAKSKYEILKAQIALEEAQNAKSTVRLQRDNEGNYGYVYTADQDKVANAEQDLADKQNAYYNLALEQANDFSQKLAQIGQEYSEARKKLDQERDEGLISEEQYQQSLIELQDYYKDLELRYLEGYNTAAGILDEEAAQGRIEAWGAGYEGILNEQRLFNNESTGAAQELNSNLQTEVQNWKDTQQALLQEAGLDNENYKQTVSDVTKEIKTLGDQITKDGGLVDQFGDAASITEKLTRDFINQYEALLNEANGYLEAANNANQYCNELMQLTNQQLQYNAAVAAQPSAVYSGNSAGGYSNNSTGDSSNVDNRTTDDTSSSSFSSKKSKGERYCRVEQVGTGYWFYAPESSVEQYRKDPNHWKVINLKSGGYTGVWTSAKTGMYTGSWNGPDIEENGKLAFLHQKELVLNANDTENMLSAIKLIRQISQTIDLQAATQSSALSLQAAQFSNNGQVLQQEVTIHAEFPNATNHNEIEEAFNNLVNRASQFASRQ